MVTSNAPRKKALTAGLTPIDTHRSTAGREQKVVASRTGSNAPRKGLNMAGSPQLRYLGLAAAGVALAVGGW